MFGTLDDENGCGDYELGGAVDRYSESSSDVIVVLWEIKIPDPVDRADEWELKNYQTRMEEEEGEGDLDEFSVLYHHRRPPT